LLSETASGFVILRVNLETFTANQLPHFKREPASLAAIVKALIGGLLFWRAVAPFDRGGGSVIFGAGGAGESTIKSATVRIAKT
jgi:hypothetical protein